MSVRINKLQYLETYQQYITKNYYSIKNALTFGNESRNKFTN